LDHDALLRLLVRLTVYKAFKQVTYHRAEKRDPHQELAADRNGHQSYLDLLASDAPPDSAAMFLDQLDHFMSQLTLTGRQVLELRLQGSSTSEIARKLNTYDRMVRRVVERIRETAKLEGLSA